MRNYHPYHEHVEQLLASVSPTSDPAELASIKTNIEVQFAAMDLDPFSPGLTAGERLSREERADQTLGKYIPEPDTGQPDPEDVSLQDGAMVSALLSGVSAVEVELTITQAFDFYMKEKNEPDPFKRKKQVQRFKRAQQDLLNVTKQDIAVSRISRAHARRLRDNLLRTKAVSTARRNINDVKSVLSLVIREYDLNINNPFTRLEFPKPNDAAVELRASLPTDVIVSMYRKLNTARHMDPIAPFRGSKRRSSWPNC